MLTSAQRSSSEPAHKEPAPKATSAPSVPGAAWSSLALQIDPADSPLEREADRVAQNVLSAPAATAPVTPSDGDSVQRKCAECEEEEERQRHDRPAFRIQRREAAQAAPLEGGAADQVRSVTAESGQPLDAPTRTYFEPRFGRDFGGVRLHTDNRASESARAIGARAYTAGPHIVFRHGEFAPATTRGRSLLAHELTHVAQQAGAVVQRAPDDIATTRSTVPGGGATPGVGGGIDVTFLVPHSSYVPDIKAYVDRNLTHEASYEVLTLDELFQLLEANAEAGIRVRRLRIVSHGLATGEVSMMNPTGANKKVLTPKDVAEYAKQPRIREIVKKSLVPGAVVEFWGCSIGRSQAAGEAWATLFGTTLRAQTETFRTGFNRFLRPAKKGEKGQTDPRKPGLWVVTRNRNEIDDSDYSTRLAFLRWLLDAYDDLVRNGDIDPVAPTGSLEGDVGKRLEYMTDLFNRSNGDLRNIEITRKGAKKYQPIRPGDGEEWNKLWRTFSPQPVEVITEHPDIAPDAPTIPDIPTDIPIREPGEAELRALGLQPEEQAALPQDQMLRSPGEPVINPLVMCRLADTSPSGSLFARVPFATDSDVIPSRYNELASFGTSLGADLQTTPIRIDGYASTDGPAQYNRGLACRRALNVSDALVRLIGVPPGNITTYAHEETAEFSTGDHAANRIALVSATPASLQRTGGGAAAAGANESATSHLGPHLLATGVDAARRVARVMPRVEPIVVTTWLGDVVMAPGSVWDNNKLLVWATPMTTYYVIDDRLYEMSTGLFLRTFWIHAMATGVKRAEWLVPIAKIEMALLTGLLVPWQYLLAVAIFDTVMTYGAHQEVFNQAYRVGSRVIAELYQIYMRSPKLFNHLMWMMTKRLGALAWENAGDLAAKFAGGISAEDVAFFIGRFLKNGYEASARTIGSALWIASYTAALVLATHAHHITLHAIEGSVEEQIAALREAMNQEGVTMTQEEARALLRELQAHPDAEQRLRVLEAALSELPPALLALEKTLDKKK